ADWKGAHVGVLGLARSGLALARVLGGLGAHVLVSDSRPESAIAAAAEEARKLGAEVETGGHSDRLSSVDLLVISPGVSVHAPVVQEALERGTPVAGEIEVAFRLCPLPIIAVTGTNGKSTTCSLIEKCLAPRSLLAGNIGVPLVSEVSSVNPADLDYIVAEISSFQLETTHGFAPKVALLTNITADHLDRHRTMEEYVAAKSRLFSHQGTGDFAIFNADDEWAGRVADWVAQGTLPDWLPGFPHRQPQGPELFRYSALGPVDQGCFLDGKDFIFRRGGVDEVLLRWDFPNLPGPHNLSNALAAALTVRLLGVGSERIREVFAAYGRLHHRLELVETFSQVRFIDDTKATNISSVEAALETYPEPTVLIAGGRDKGLDLDLLGQVIAKHAFGLIAIGEAGPTISQASRAAGLQRIESGSSMQEAVDKAYEMCPRPGVVLLSPACASFDMFNNAEHRGEVFAASVKTL
ncbi:unnamed protein product, partial [Phaeothamnion confervicola]